METVSVKSSNASHVTGAWYREMAKKINSKRSEICQARMEIDPIFRRQVIMDHMRVLAFPFLVCFLKGIKKMLNSGRHAKNK